MSSDSINNWKYNLVIKPSTLSQEAETEDKARWDEINLRIAKQVQIGATTIKTTISFQPLS